LNKKGIFNDFFFFLKSIFATKKKTPLGSRGSEIFLKIVHKLNDFFGNKLPTFDFDFDFLF
jgi:hypothetical protein